MQNRLKLSGLGRDAAACTTPHPGQENKNDGLRVI